MVVVIVAVFILESVLDFLNEKSSGNALEPEIASLYDAKERNRAQEYGNAKYRLGLFSSTFNTAVLILALTQGWIANIDTWARGVSGNSILISLIFIGALSVVSWWLNLPFALYGTFVVEQRFGFNKTTISTFVSDAIKGTLVSIVIGAPVLAAIIWLYQNFTDRFWLYGWLLTMAISIFMFMFGTRLILPLFNKLTPLPEGELRTAIIEYCATQGYSLSRLFVMDGSKRSTKANAFFSGLGRSKTIVLFDTLIEKLTTAEVVAVLAHEVGHYKRRHSQAMLIASSLQSLAIFALLGWALGYAELSSALGAKESSFHLGAFTFFILLGPLNLILGLLNNSLSRRNEFDADQFALETYKSGDIGSALKKISKDSLANLTPHPLYVAFNYTHPTLAQRLRALR